MSQPLFQLNISHQYYQNGVLPYLELMPDINTAVFLTRYSLVLHCVGSTYRLNYFGSNNYDSFKSNLTALLDYQPLRFILKTKSNAFYVITDLPVDWRGDINFDTEHINYEQSESSLMMQLSVRALNNSDEIGLVSIDPKTLFEQQRFDIQFTARKTHWCYLLFNRTDIRLITPMIKDKQGTYFQNPTPIKAVNGEQGLQFSSGEHAFIMQEKPQHKFQLINSVENKNSSLSPEYTTDKYILIGELPTPEIDKIYINQLGGKQQVYSQMYVYL